MAKVLHGRGVEDVEERLAGFDERIDTEWADGYLTAIAAGPRAVPDDEWLAAMCGDAFDRVFADPDDQAQATASELAAKEFPDLDVSLRGAVSIARRNGLTRMAFQGTAA